MECSVEFVLVSGPVAQQAELLKKACGNASRICPVDGAFLYNEQPGLFVAGAKPMQSAGHTYFWDGHGVAGHTAFSSGTNLAPTASDLKAYHHGCLSGYSTDALTRRMLSDMRGVFASVAVDETHGTFSIVVDPLSQYSLFTWKIGSSICVSNSVYLIESIAKTLDVPLSRDPNVGCFEVACTVGAGTRTGYKGVEVQKFGQIITGERGNWGYQDTKFRSFPEGATYEELLELSAARLTSYMTALDKATSDTGLLFDLTGGQDSRICFAAAVGAGVKNLNIFVGGDDGDDDKYVARQLANKFGATEGNFPENYTESSVSANEQARRATFRQQGHSTLYHYALGAGRLNDVCRVRGGAGELIRSHMLPVDSGCFFTSHPMKSVKQLLGGDTVYRQSLKKYWLGFLNLNQRMASRWAYKLGAGLRAKRGHSLYTRSFQENAINVLMQDHLLNAESLESMGLDLYFKDRTRRHFAFISRALNYSSGAFEPLSDPVLIAAAQALPWDERVSGRFVFELIEKMAGKDMLKVPFAKKSMQAEPSEYLARQLECSLDSIAAVDRALMPATQKAKINAGVKVNRWADFDGPNGLGVHAKYLWQNRNFMKELAEGLGCDHELWKILNRENFLSSIQSDYFFSGGNKATHGLRFLHMLIWLNYEESRIGIGEIIST